MDFNFDDPRMIEHVRRVQELARDLSLIGELKAPGLMDIVNAPVIDRWTIGQRSEPALVGIVQGHPLLSDGPVTTSVLHCIDPIVGYARTLSRWYRLGSRK